VVTYDFYQNTYLGSALSEPAFRSAAARAESYLAALERSCQVSAAGPDSRAMAVCALAEKLDALRRTERVSQSTVGGVSIRYDHSGVSAERELLRTAGVYLDIYRGVG
jgi:hypothetical protein